MKISRENSKLICITGYMGCGKTTATHFFDSLSYKTFIMDEYIHKIYKKSEIGYDLIVKNFGIEYVNSLEVDRPKLKELILSDENQRIKLDNLMQKIMLEKLEELYFLNENLIVEFGVYIYNQAIYFNYFKSIILVSSNRENIVDNFKKFHYVDEFPTKYVENSKIYDFSSFLYVDFIVENNESIENFKKKLMLISKKI